MRPAVFRAGVNERKTLRPGSIISEYEVDRVGGVARVRCEYGWVDQDALELCSGDIIERVALAEPQNPAMLRRETLARKDDAATARKRRRQAGRAAVRSRSR